MAHLGPDRDAFLYRAFIREAEDGSLVVVEVWRSGDLLFRTTAPLPNPEEVPLQGTRKTTDGGQ